MPLFKLGFPLLAASIAALTVAVLSADFSESAWRYYRPVLLPNALADISLVELVPELGVFHYASPGLADLRIIEVVSQSETQFKLLVERGEHRRTSISAKMLDLSYKAGETTSFVLDLEQEGVLHSELELRTTSKNFQRDVVVEGSLDGLNWRVLKTDGRIFDFTIDEAGEDQGFSARDTRINYPASTVRYLQVTIDEPGQDLIAIDGAQVFFAQQFAPKRTSLPAEILSRGKDTERNQTSLVLDLGSPGFPANQLILTTEQENFHRRVILEASSDSVNWRPVSRLATIFSFNTPLFVGSDLSISFPESPSRYYRLTIVNEDTADLRVFLNKADGTGLFHDFLTPPSPVQDRASPSEPADFDRDGITDICVANLNTNTVSVLRGRGDGTFDPQQIIPVGLLPRGIVVLDVDGDGDIDIHSTVWQRPLAWAARASAEQ